MFYVTEDSMFGWHSGHETKEEAEQVMQDFIANGYEGQLMVESEREYHLRIKEVMRDMFCDLADEIGAFA